MTTLPQTRSSLSLQELLRWLCCPLCKGDLELGQELLFCAHCQRGYPIVLGIPDLRVYPDPYVTFEEDHFKGRQVQEQEAKLSFPELLQFYWENVSKPPTPVELRNRFIRHVLTDEERVRRFPVAGVRGRRASTSAAAQAQCKTSQTNDSTLFSALTSRFAGWCWRASGSRKPACPQT